MKWTLIQFPGFTHEWRRLKLTDDDLRALERALMERPEAGVIVSGTGGLRKVRFAPPSWRTGKSGATRICYIVIAAAETIYLLDIFAKNDRSNLTKAERNALRELIERLKRTHREDEP